MGLGKLQDALIHEVKFKLYKRKIPLLESKGGTEGWIEMPASRRIKYIRRPAGVVLTPKGVSPQEFWVT